LSPSTTFSNISGDFLFSSLLSQLNIFTRVHCPQLSINTKTMLHPPHAPLYTRLAGRLPPVTWNNGDVTL